MPALLKNPTDKEVKEFIDRCENFHIEGGSQSENVKQVQSTRQTAMPSLLKSATKLAFERMNYTL